MGLLVNSSGTVTAEDGAWYGVSVMQAGDDRAEKNAMRLLGCP